MWQELQGAAKGEVQRQECTPTERKNKRTRTDKIQATTDLGTFEVLTAWPLELGVPSLRKDRTLGTRLSAVTEREEAKRRTECSG